MPAVLVRRLDRPPARHGALARAAGRAGERGRYPAGVLRLHGARVPLPGAVCQSVPAPPAQARVRPLRAVRHGAQRGIGRARGRDGTRGRRRAGVRFGGGRGTVARVRRGRGLRVRRSLAARVLLLARLRGMDRRMLCRGVHGERGGRRARYRAAPADRAHVRRARAGAHAPRRPGRSGRPGGARRGPARGRMGLVRVPTGVLHRVHHPHGLRRLLRHVARRAPGRGRMG